jgi:hypothetical protein
MRAFVFAALAAIAVAVVGAEEDDHVAVHAHSTEPQTGPETFYDGRPLDYNCSYYPCSGLD